MVIIITMKIIDFLKEEIKSLSIFERIFFLCAITIILITSILTKDNKLALISSICGICYTILAGKGKIYCYFIGMIGTFCYSYLSFKNSFYGNFLLYFCYYLPMEIIGIFKWKKHLKTNSSEIIKSSLSIKERIIYASLTILITIIFAFVLFLVSFSGAFCFIPLCLQGLAESGFDPLIGFYPSILFDSPRTKIGPCLAYVIPSFSTLSPHFA